MSRADAELPWYFGTGPSTAAGDSGLRSPFGGQLEAARLKQPGGHTVNASQAEDDMIRRVGSAALMGEIRDRLATLSQHQFRILQLHYGTRPLAFGVSGAAVLVEESRALCGPDGVTRERLNAVLTEAAKANTAARPWANLELAVLELLGPARAAYNGAVVRHRRRLWAQ